MSKRGLDDPDSKQVGSTAECPKLELKISSQGGMWRSWKEKQTHIRTSPKTQGTFIFIPSSTL